jgi:putative membrane protein
MYARSGLDSAIRRIPAGGFVVLYLFSAVAGAGFATFGLNPGLLGYFPPRIAAFYGISFDFFAQVQIWLAGAVLALFLAVHAARRWLGAFTVVYLISLGSELLGTGVGIPFGEYRYTEALGPMWFGHVPVVIPLSWFFMALPSYALARAALPGRPLARVVMASLVLLSWDLALDPAMSRATAYWIWAEPGAYYGMPWLNLFGWYVTGVALMAAFAIMGSDRWIAALPHGWLTAFYGANLLLPLGMSAAAGLWGAVAATAAALLAAGLLGRSLALRRRARGALAEAAG